MPTGSLRIQWYVHPGPGPSDDLVKVVVLKEEGSANRVVWDERDNYEPIDIDGIIAHASDRVTRVLTDEIEKALKATP